MLTHTYTRISEHTRVCGDSLSGEMPSKFHFHTCAASPVLQVASTRGFVEPAPRARHRVGVLRRANTPVL